METAGIAWHLKCSDNQGDARSLQGFYFPAYLDKVEDTEKQK